MKKTTYSCDWCGIESKDEKGLHRQSVHNHNELPHTAEICLPCKNAVRAGILEVMAKRKRPVTFDHSPGAMNYYDPHKWRSCDICGQIHEIWEACPYVAESEKTVMFFRDKPADWWMKLRRIAESMMREAEQPSGRASIEEMSRHLK